MKIDKNASNQKMDTIFDNKLFKMYNFVAWPKKQLFTLKVLKMHFVFVKTFRVNESFLAKLQSRTS